MVNFIMRPEVISSETRRQDVTAVDVENGGTHIASPRQRSLRLLSLDGGGVRGIGTLHILKHIMSKAGGDGLKPCDYFDMIAGTSTGGLLAIMLGRLGMSIDECIEAYNDLSSKIFGQNRWWPRVVLLGHSRYSSLTFEETVKEFILKRTGDSESLMMQTQIGKHCKVFVVAVQAKNVNNEAPLHIRTYPPGENESVLNDVKIWEACRATTAAPLYFEPMQIGDTHYQDGGLTHNNPMSLLINEAEALFGRNADIQCALSIGTGLAPKVDLRGSTSILGVLRGTFINNLLALVTNTQQHHFSARKHFNNCRKGACYFRFNVGEKLTDKYWVDERDKAIYHSLYGNSSTTKIPNPKEWENALIALDEYKQMDRFARICEEYIQDKSLEKQVERCAEKLKRVRARPNVRLMTI